MMKNTGYLFAFISLLMLNSCEKVIDIDLSDGESLPYIDAWITNKPGIQTIKFLKAVNYLDQQAPQPIADAQISLTDMTLNKTYPFEYDNGAYSYDAGIERVGKTGHRYKLNILYNGEKFEAEDSMKRPTAVDSVKYEFREQDGEEKEGYYAEFFATDPSGGTDYTWIRTYRNGALNAYVGEMISIDGTFDAGISDGFMFIPPFREGITSSEEPYQKGDELKVTIRSLSENTYNFLDQSMEQLYSGGLFAKILQNVPTNVFSQDAGSKTKIYGWFGATAEAGLTVTIQ